MITVGLMLVAACGSDPDTVAEPAVETDTDGTAGETDSPEGTGGGSAGEGEGSTEDGDAAAEESDASGEDGGELFPDVVAATADLGADGSWTFSATLSSPYDTPERYADAWRVIGPDGEVYGVRELAHDHQAEQPFTRSQGGIRIPDDVEVVTVQGRDQASGWGGDTVEVRLQR